MKQKVHQHNWYLRNKVRHIKNVTKIKAAKIKENRKLLLEYFSTHPCIDCGETDPVVLDFDHVRDVKVKNVSALIAGTWKRIEKEIAKCEVRCANCHRRITHKRRFTHA